VGYAPFAPGTAGSLVGLALACLAGGSLRGGLLLTLSVAVAGLFTIPPVVKATGQRDPSHVVIDEVAGMVLAVAGWPVNWKVFLVGWILFRLMDVWKPFPVRRLEAIPGAWGVLLDDLAAAGYVQLCFYGYHRLW